MWWSWSGGGCGPVDESRKEPSSQGPLFSQTKFQIVLCPVQILVFVVDEDQFSVVKIVEVDPYSIWAFYYQALVVVH